MTSTNAVPCSSFSVEELFEKLKISKQDCLKAIKEGYTTYPKIKRGKVRWINKPNDTLKAILKALNEILQQILLYPSYCMTGLKGRNNLLNAKEHIKKREVITLDIEKYFPSTKAKYIKKLFEECLGVSKDDLELLVQLTTYKGHLPTGAPTSPLLAFLVHKEIFDCIHEKMQKNDIDMTVYADDITLSTYKHIQSWVIPYIKNALKTHGLYLKASKIKRFGYKHAIVTGVYISQCGKVSAPFEIGHTVIKALKEKDLCQMTTKELRGIIAKISYIQQFQTNKMAATKSKAIRQLKRLQKIKDNAI